MYFGVIKRFKFNIKSFTCQTKNYENEKSLLHGSSGDIISVTGCSDKNRFNNLQIVLRISMVNIPENTSTGLPFPWAELVQE